MKVRKPALAFYGGIILITAPLFTIFMLINGPDLSEEQVLQNRIVELHERLRHAEMLNQERRRDVITLREHFDLILQVAENGRNDVPANSNNSIHVGRGALSRESQKFLASLRGSLDLQLPSIHHFLPHLLGSPDSLQPAFRLSKGRTGVTMVLGIPTVQRAVQSYLMSTLHNLIENMSPEEKLESVIVVFIAETDKDYVAKQAAEIESQFSQHLETGLLEVIAPPASYYPDMSKLHQTLGDPIDRVKWRTKQNLDFAYLMMYAQAKGTFYVQLEDDILTKPGYITKMKNFAYKQSSEKKNWMVLDFCQLGFIGKMFKCVDLSQLVVFFIMFHNDKPVDWLLEHMIQTKVCRFDKDVKECKKQKDTVWYHYKPSLFQHVGTHSSLKGKVQKLKDKQFGKLALHISHKNPPAHVSSTLKAYKSYTIQRAYTGETFFWSLLPQRGDNVTIRFISPILIDTFLFRSGNPEHPEDKFFNTSVEVLPVTEYYGSDLQQTADGFYIVGHFKEQTGIAEGTVPAKLGPIKVLRLYVHSESDRWGILSEIFIKQGGGANTKKALR